MRHSIASALPRRSGASLRATVVALTQAEYQRFRRLDRAKQWILAGLAVAAALVMLAALVYLTAPGSDAVTPPPPISGSSVAPAGTTGLTGQFIANDPVAGPSMLDLRQFGDQISGTRTTVTCAGQAAKTTTQIVTASFLSDGALSLTISAASQARSQTIIYTYATNPVGFDLVTRDAAGKPVDLAWQHGSQPTFAALAASFCAGQGA